MSKERRAIGNLGVGLIVIISLGCLIGIIYGVASVVDQNKKLTNQVEQLREDNDELDSVIETMTDSNKRITDELWNLKETLKKQKADSDDLKKDRNSLQKDVEGLESDKKKLQEENSKLKNQVSMKKEKATSPSATVKTTTTVPSRGEQPSGKSFYVESTAYTALCDTGCTGVTRTGINLLENPSAKVIAVDPSIIPLGSKVYVEGYGYAIAGDTGGAIKGYRVDLFMQHKSDALEWGRKRVKITIL